ncbi:TetR/AcrR family transcriptional regulator [Rhodobacter sp. Har01]|uniref:helix-turn-helix domain-containing protein n=1 Tax=Rhodobacter sp. Har01 TaxID=2883999 RepID=UPI001D062FC4|nr:helix-turn-helix domain-containing protein [Rhodobacter sp. Har01]MCB6176924.1 TetR/AcrR family transcriptional regulator [Rhodobacter sp. Har01]
MRIIHQLGREDWIEAGLAVLCSQGHAALRVEATARRLGVSKGSFYWHFRDRSAWRDALLGYWEHLVFAGLLREGAKRQRPPQTDKPEEGHWPMAEVRSPQPGQDDRLRRQDGGSAALAGSRRIASGQAAAAVLVDPGRLEAAFRLWAQDDAWVARAVARVQKERRSHAMGLARLSAASMAHPGNREERRLARAG